MATSTSTQLLSSEDAVLQCCFTSTETLQTIRPVRDREPRTASLTFTQLLSSEGNVLGEVLFHGSYEGKCLPKYWSLKKVILHCKIDSNSILIPHPLFFSFFWCWVCVCKQPD